MTDPATFPPPEEQSLIEKNQIQGYTLQLMTSLTWEEAMPALRAIGANFAPFFVACDRLCADQNEVLKLIRNTATGLVIKDQQQETLDPAETNDATSSFERAAKKQAEAIDDFIREASTMPIENYQCFQDIQRKQGTETVIAIQTRSLDLLKLIFPEFYRLNEVLCCHEGETPYENLRRYYADEFPYLSFADVSAQNDLHKSWIDRAKLEELYQATQKWSSEKAGAYLNDLFNHVTPEYIAEQISAFFDVASKSAIHLLMHPQAQTLPDEAKKSFQNIGKEVANLLATIRNVAIEHDIPIFSRFDELLEATRKNKQAYLADKAHNADPKPDGTAARERRRKTKTAPKKGNDGGPQ